MNVLHI
jgi:FMN-dependent NADH-azoreductase